jgi:hypothetical protein
VRRILDALWVNLKGMYKLFLREDYHFALVKS